MLPSVDPLLALPQAHAGKPTKMRMERRPAHPHRLGQVIDLQPSM
jgi:hypothetical protein